MPRKAREAREKTAGPGEVRDRILTAAVALLRSGGIGRFTQLEVAAQAGVRHSHLTYYFPTRQDLLEATTMRVVDGIACGLGHVVSGESAGALAPTLARLAAAVSELDHLRMFLGVIVEADQDPALRALLVRGTQRLETALAEQLGGKDAEERARAVLATMWGLALYGFVMRPARNRNPTPTALAWLERALTGKRSTHE